MTVITQKADSLLNVVKNIDDIAIDATKKHSALMADLNRKQLLSGTNALGTDMPAYVANSKAPRAPGKIKLFDTGKFQKGITPLFDNSGIDMTSKDEKVKFLDPKYPTALGLDPKSVEILQEEIVDTMLVDIRKKL